MLVDRDLKGRRSLAGVELVAHDLNGQDDYQRVEDNDRHILESVKERTPFLGQCRDERLDSQVRSSFQPSRSANIR